LTFVRGGLLGVVAAAAACARHVPPDGHVAASPASTTSAGETASAPPVAETPPPTPPPLPLPPQPQPTAAADPEAPRTDPPQEPATPRLGWPDDKQLTGIYANIGMMGAKWFPGFLGRLAKNGMNAVVVDGKDYEGWVTYPSAIPLAAETHATSHAVVKSLPALVRAAHDVGIRVLLRVSCFHDPWMADRRPELAIRGMRGWLDPNKLGAQDYLLGIVDETMAAGVDEIQLDYVRYPTEWITHADFALGGKKTTDVIAGFVRRVHERTQAAGVPLSVDIFGVVAWQRAVDVMRTGQDLTRLGSLVEAVSPMVYPSHFQEGFNGYSAPGEHPEVVASGTHEAMDVLKRSGSRAIIRPWIQAFSWHAPGYDTSYVVREIAGARAARGTGWLAWNAGGYYSEVLSASWEDSHAGKTASR
jgi:hypothetical protein